MAINDKKISKIVSKQFPEFVRSRHPELLTFIEKYYTLMESAVLTLSDVDVIDNIQLETAETSFLQLNATDQFNANNGDYIIDEQSLFGEFQSGEIITGATSGQTATILVEDADNLKLYVTANTKFIIGETITGATSGARAKIGNYRGNPVENINQLLEYVDIDNTLDNFFLEFRNQLLDAIPNNLVAGLDKRQFAKNITDLYQKKGTTEGHKAFFRALLNENTEIYYPTVDMLRVSDGEWRKRKLLKVVLSSPVDADTSNLLNQTITQTDIVDNDHVNIATAVVNGVEKETIDGTVVTTLYLEEDSIVGDFRYSTDPNSVVGQVFITGVDRTDPEVLIQCVVTSSIDQITIDKRGAYYVVDDTIGFTNVGTGKRGSLRIADVSSSDIPTIQVENGGSGYAENDVVVVDNTGTGGTGLAAKVRVVNGGFTLEGEDDSGFQLLDEDGGLVVMEPATNSNLNDITDIQVTASGGGYEKLPALSVTSTLGTDADLFAVSTDVGQLLKINVADHGYNYQTVPDVNIHTHLQVTNLSDSYIPGETVTSTTTDSIIAEIFEPITHTFLTEPSRSAEYRLEDDLGGIQLENATYDYTGVEEKLLIDDMPKEENIVRKNILGTTYSDEIHTEDGYRLVLDGVQEALQVTNIVDETGAVLSISVLSGGIGGTPGTYNITTTTTTGNGSNIQLTITTDGTAVPSETDILITDGGDDYGVNETITIDGSTYLGGASDLILNIVTTSGDNFLLEQQTTTTAVVEQFLGASNILEMNDIDNTFQVGETITGNTSGCTSTIVNDDSGEVTATIGTIVTTSGEYVNVDGHVSESTKKIQDSFYYQDYSYVVKIGESIRTWRDDVKRSMHPAGFNVFGEVAIATQVNAQLKRGFTLSSGHVDPDEVLELMKIIFGEKIGRRLGTATDGTSLRSTPNAGIEGSTSFGNTRDLTLSTERTITFNSNRQRQVQSVNVTRGFVYAGPRYSNINRFASTAFDTTASDSGITLDVLNNIKIRGTGKTPPNENTPTFADFTSDLRTNFTLPTEITTST